MTIAPDPPSKRLVLVLGAGASKEVDLPVGQKLKHIVGDSLSFQIDRGRYGGGGDPTIYQCLQTLSRATTNVDELNAYLRAAQQISEAMPLAMSIDNYIDAHRNDPKVATCGKLAIARSILAAESTSKLMVPLDNIYNTLNFRPIESTWYVALFQLLFENCSVGDIESRLDALAIVSFNYDRCFEHFLYWAIQNYYNLNPDGAAQLVRRVEIHHPYGRVGSLPWQGQANPIAFGAAPQFGVLGEVTRSLRTFTEGTDPSTSDIQAIRSAVRNAEQLVFLGFAFHPLNLELLYEGIGEWEQHPTHTVLATGIGLSEADIGVISDTLRARGGYTGLMEQGGPLRIERGLPCADLLRQYGRQIGRHLKGD